jgi:hypothetical protein
MRDWEMMEQPRTWRIWSSGHVVHRDTADSAEAILDDYVSYLVQHRQEYGYPDDYELRAVCVETGERVTARGRL